jgi:hypothetical protein
MAMRPIPDDLLDRMAEVLIPEAGMLLTPQTRAWGRTWARLALEAAGWPAEGPSWTPEPGEAHTWRWEADRGVWRALDVPEATAASQGRVAPIETPDAGRIPRRSAMVAGWEIGDQPRPWSPGVRLCAWLECGWRREDEPGETYLTIEKAIRAHLDAEHAGWTLEEVRRQADRTAREGVLVRQRSA